MTVIEHERIDAGKDNAPRIFHIYVPANAPRTICGLPRTAKKVYTAWAEAPPHQCCVMCAEINGGPF